jgi:hypothetical protein
MILIAPHNFPISMTSDRTLRITIVVFLSSPTVFTFFTNKKDTSVTLSFHLRSHYFHNSIHPLFLPLSNLVSLRSRDATVLLLFYKRRIYQGEGQGLLMIDLDVLWILVWIIAPWLGEQPAWSRANTRTVYTHFCRLWDRLVSMP